ncbi:MAG: ATP-dependent sacrificial sulfur transferase LarE [Bacillota bacterium]
MIYIEILAQRMETLVKEGVCIAFSGGADSALLLKMASLAKEKIMKETKKLPVVVALTFDTALHPKTDLVAAKKLTEEFQVEHVIFSINELDNEVILQNPVDRCYHCKKYLFETVKTFAKEREISHIIDGTNFDDLSEYRPGLLALKELQIESPLAEAEITKEKVREQLKKLGLAVAKRPSAPCLATRIPYDTKIDLELLAQIDKGEQYLQSIGFLVNRIRVHGLIARIEIEKSQFALFLQKQEEITQVLHDLNFTYITLDLEGFRSGSMDIHL